MITAIILSDIVYRPKGKIEFVYADILSDTVFNTSQVNKVIKALEKHKGKYDKHNGSMYYDENTGWKLVNYIGYNRLGIDKSKLLKTYPIKFNRIDELVLFARELGIRLIVGREINISVESSSDRYLDKVVYKISDDMIDTNRVKAYQYILEAVRKDIKALSYYSEIML